MKYVNERTEVIILSECGIYNIAVPYKIRMESKSFSSSVVGILNSSFSPPLFLQAQRKEVFLQERYGHYSLTDPFLALQRDFECRVPGGNKERVPLESSPISILEAVMAHCRKMQESMSAQLAAAESRQRRVRH